MFLLCDGMKARILASSRQVVMTETLDGGRAFSDFKEAAFGFLTIRGPLRVCYQLDASS